MTCTTNLPVVDVNFAAQRQAICASCEHANGDTCQVVEAKHPGRSSIKNGTARKSLSCPNGKWQAIPSQCKSCHRKYGIGMNGLCVWCQNERAVAVANANIRARRRAPVPTVDRVQSSQLPKVTLAESRTAAKWQVIVTTAPRTNCTLNRCLRSIESAGWTELQTAIFAEPGSSRARFGYTIANSERRGAWHNWLASCEYALRQGTDFILTVQDDSLFHPDSRELIESIRWPSRAGFVSLYTPSHYSFNRHNYSWKPKGIRPVRTSSLWGACALVWRPDVLRQVIEHDAAKAWLGASYRTRATKQKHPEQIANVDTAIGTILNRIGLAMYFVDPSPVAHIATHSTLKHGGNGGKRNAIRIADASMPLIPQVFDGAKAKGCGC